MKEDVKRVFFHELGHFVAHEINKRYYHGTGTKSIEIFPFPYNNELFEGDAKINCSEDEREKNVPRIELLAEYLASSTYGCIFQSYYKNEETFDDCFKDNGRKDSEQWLKAMRNYRIDDYKSEITRVESGYFKMLRKKGALDNFMTLEPENYLTDRGFENYSVDVDKLRKDTENIVTAHQKDYDELIQKYQAYIDTYYQAPQ